jgi:hypothetical protein
MEPLEMSAINKIILDACPIGDESYVDTMATDILAAIGFRRIEKYKKRIRNLLSFIDRYPSKDNITDEWKEYIVIVRKDIGEDDEDE